ncbi:MAG: SLBB domain-containing protein [Kovacikia sp.]
MSYKVPRGSLKELTQLTASLTLLTTLAVAYPLPGAAQTPAQKEASPTTTSVNTGLGEVDEAYTLGPGDRVRIDVFKLTQYSGENQVLADGTLNLPQIGSVSVVGMTLKEATAALSAQYGRLLKYPIVTITLLTPRPVKVGVSGEVNRPGAYTIPTTDTGSQLSTVTKALQLAGGITQLADLRRVKIRRPQRSGSSQLIQVNLWDFLQTGNLSQDVTLRSGDAIFVPTVSKTNLAESVQIASASFATDRSRPLNIAVVGEVYRPGPYTVTASSRTGAAGETGQTGGAGETEKPPTITRAIQVAGGIKPQADVRRVQVRRITKTGSEQTIDIDLWKLLQTGDLNQDLILQDRDTVVIPTATNITAAEATQIAAASFSPDSIRVNVVGEVKQPGIVKVPPNTPLNQALLAAGGFNVRARKSSVDLIRLNPDGTVSRRSIPIDLAQGINEKSNPALRNDDIIVANRSGLTVFSDNLNAVVTPISNFLSIFSLYTILK